MARAKRITTPDQPAKTSSSSLAVMDPRSSSREARDAEEVIRLRAYALYEERGRQHGQALNDWLRAEREILQRATGRRSA